MNQKKTYYDILGISQESSKEQIMGKFKELISDCFTKVNNSNNYMSFVTLFMPV